MFEVGQPNTDDFHIQPKPPGRHKMCAKPRFPGSQLPLAFVIVTKAGYAIQPPAAGPETDQRGQSLIRTDTDGLLPILYKIENSDRVVAAVRNIDKSRDLYSPDLFGYIDKPAYLVIRIGCRIDKPAYLRSRIRARINKPGDLQT